MPINSNFPNDENTSDMLHKATNTLLAAASRSHDHE